MNPALHSAKRPVQVQPKDVPECSSLWLLPPIWRQHALSSTLKHSNMRPGQLVTSDYNSSPNSSLQFPLDAWQTVSRDRNFTFVSSPPLPFCFGRELDCISCKQQNDLFPSGLSLFRRMKKKNRNMQPSSLVKSILNYLWRTEAKSVLKYLSNEN